MVELNELLDPSNVRLMYNELVEATKEHYLNEALLLNAQTGLRSWYARSIAEGVIVGKNDTEREGNAQILRPDLYESVAEYEVRVAQSKLRLEIARIREREMARIISISSLYVGLYEKGIFGLAAVYPPAYPNAAREGGADSWVTPEDTDNSHT